MQQSAQTIIRYIYLKIHWMNIFCHQFYKLVLLSLCYRAVFKSGIALVLLYYALWLVKKTRATFSTNQMQNQNQSQLGHTRFPALGAVYAYLLRVLIGSFCYLSLLWLAIVIALVFVLRHSIENRSISCSSLYLYFSKRYVFKSRVCILVCLYSGTKLSIRHNHLIIHRLQPYNSGFLR